MERYLVETASGDSHANTGYAILHRSGRRLESQVLFINRGPGLEFHGGGEADAHQVRGHGQAGQGVGGLVIDRVLDVLQEAGRNVGRDAVHVDDEGSGLALEDQVLDTGDLQELEAQGGFVGSCRRLDFKIEPEAVVVVGFGFPTPPPGRRSWSRAGRQTGSRRSG